MFEGETPRFHEQTRIQIEEEENTLFTKTSKHVHKWQGHYGHSQIKTIIKPNGVNGPYIVTRRPNPFYIVVE